MPATPARPTILPPILATLLVLLALGAGVLSWRAGEASREAEAAGSRFALALAVLGARGIVNPHLLEGVVHLGELGLDGSVRPVRGVLPAVAAAVGAGIDQVVVAEGSAGEAALVPGAEVTGVSHLTELVARYGGEVTGVLPTARRRPALSSRPAPASGAAASRPG